MQKKLESSTAIFLSSLFFVGFAVLLCLEKVEPPANMLTVTGPLTSLTPIYSDRAGMRFRFCMGNPVLTFTYQGPNIERAWSALNSVRRASVLYAPDRGRMLWGLEVKGSFSVTTEELQRARMQHLLFLLACLIISGAVAVNGIVKALTKRAEASR